AQDTRFDDAKPQPVDQQRRSLPDDFVLEDKVLWLDDMLSKVIFQLEERMQPFAITCEYGRAVAEDGEGGFLICRHGFEFPVITRHDQDGREVADIRYVYCSGRPIHTIRSSFGCLYMRTWTGRL